MPTPVFDALHALIAALEALSPKGKGAITYIALESDVYDTMLNGLESKNCTATKVDDDSGDSFTWNGIRFISERRRSAYDEPAVEFQQERIERRNRADILAQMARLEQNLDAARTPPPSPTRGFRAAAWTGRSVRAPNTWIIPQPYPVTLREAQQDGPTPPPAPQEYMNVYVGPPIVNRVTEEQQPTTAVPPSTQD